MIIRIFYLMALATIAGWPGIAAADGWQYCLAWSHPDHRAYVSGISREGPGTEAELARAAENAGLRIDAIQCPRADDRAALLAMKSYAIDYNRRIGMTVIELPKSPVDQARR